MSNESNESVEGFTDYIFERLALDAEEDVVIRIDDESMAYVDIEDQSIYLITVNRAKLEAAS
jgi:hypothetical protein